MRRREFIVALGGTAAIWPLAARSQQTAMPIIGYLGSETPELWAGRLRAFLQGLSETGYVEGRNVAIEYRWAEGKNDRLAALAADLVRRQVTVLTAPGSTPAALAAKAATATIPIVFYVGGDPIALGLVASLARPSGNLTGICNLSLELGSKQLELLHELVPTATTIALLDPALAETQLRDMQAATRARGLQVHVLRASTERDFETAFASLAQLQVGGLVIGTNTFFNSRNEQLAVLALRHGVTAIHQFREFAAAGGLMSYGGNTTEFHRLAGVYAGRILGGEKPADLPVQQSTKVELVVNLKSAKALGIIVPATLLARADEVRQGLLIEIVPGARRMAALFDPGSKSPAQLQGVVDAARASGVALSTHSVTRVEEIVPAMNAAKAKGAEALNVLSSVLLNAARQVIFDQAAALRIPAIYQFPESAEQGGFIGYGPSIEQIYRRMAVIVAGLFRGDRPHDLPVQQPTTFELIINLKTGNALGLTIPETLLIRADKVIE